MQKSGAASNGATVDYFHWVSGQPSSSRVLPPPLHAPLPKTTWELQPMANFNEYDIRGTTIDASLRAQENWHLADLGRGAFTFDTENAGSGLVIALLGWNSSDLNGLYIVLDDDEHKSYVLRLSKIGNNGLLRGRIGGGMVTGQREYASLPGVTVNSRFRLNGTAQSFWVMYQKGAVVVGEGKTPGEGTPILHYAVDAAQLQRPVGQELYKFGFARLGSRWPGAITVRNARSFRYALGEYFPLPSKQLITAMGAPNITAKNGILYEPLFREEEPAPEPRNIDWGEQLKRTGGVPSRFSTAK